RTTLSKSSHPDPYPGPSPSLWCVHSPHLHTKPKSFHSPPARPAPPRPVPCRCPRPSRPERNDDEPVCSVLNTTAPVPGSPRLPCREHADGSAGGNPSRAPRLGWENSGHGDAPQLGGEWRQARIPSRGRVHGRNRRIRNDQGEAAEGRRADGHTATYSGGTERTPVHQHEWDTEHSSRGRSVRVLPAKRGEQTIRA
ncbi:hypothetical protein THAOC_08558, partial [Thalassiosira oceanica]